MKVVVLLSCCIFFIFFQSSHAEEQLYPMFFRTPAKPVVENPKFLVIKKTVRKKNRRKTVRLNGCLHSADQQALWLDKKLLLSLPKSSRVVVNQAGECLLQRGEKKIEVGERFVR